MTSDEEAAKIRPKLDEGWRGPVLTAQLSICGMTGTREGRRERERHDEASTASHP